MKALIPQIPFYYIRHGQTDWNLKKMIQGHTDIPLNERGLDQARAAATFLANRHITQIVASPLVRALKTAEIINETLQVPLRVHDGLKERCLGALEGTVKTELMLSNITTGYTQMAEGAESVDVFKKRVADTLHTILHKDEVTLVVSHGGVYYALMDIIGFEGQASSNATPYFFNPNNVDSHLLFSVTDLKK